VPSTAPFVFRPRPIVGAEEIERAQCARKTSGHFHMSWHLTAFADCLLRAEEYDQADLVLREAEQLVAETDEGSHGGGGVASAERSLVHCNRQCQRRDSQTVGRRRMGTLAKCQTF
jgi:hypothetical protein